MGETKKKKTRQKDKNTIVPKKGFIVKDDRNYNEMKPVFKFSNADPNKFTLNKWQSNEIKDLMKTFRTMEQLSWKDIRIHKGLGVKPIDNLNKPSYISPDKSIIEIRVCKKKRLFGFIDKNIFNIVWFDRDHSVCPEGKNRKHG